MTNTQNDSQPQSPNDDTYPLDLLLQDLAKYDAGDSTSGMPAERANDEDDPTWNSLIRSLRTVDEALLVAADISADVDFVLSRTEPLSDAELDDMLRGADQGVQLAAGRHRDLGQTLDDFNEIVTSASAQPIDPGPLESFKQLVERLREAGTASFHDFEPEVVATWVRELEVPWAPLLGALEPHPNLDDQDPRGHIATEMMLRAADAEWATYAHSVIELVNADQTLSSSGETREETVDGWNKEDASHQ